MSSKTHLQLFQPSSKLLPRRAFTLIELTIVSVLLAIMAAVAFPKWSQSLERTKVSGMQRAVETDIAFLCRHSVRRGRATTISFTTGSATLQFTPPLPGVLGDADGLVRYNDRFPGPVIAQADFDGSNQVRINQFGELIHASSGARLSVGRLTFRSGSTTMTSDVLSAQGTSPTPPLIP